MLTHVNARSFLRDPARITLFLAGASSIATLLLYFYGILEMRYSVPLILAPSIVALWLLALICARTHRPDIAALITSGVSAGLLATLTYDVVRVPIAWTGIPIFKAISYFGTVILQQPAPTLPSEVVGWLYHITNGVGFALMYVAMFRQPRWWTALLWALFLEAAMFVTPYAEVFGYSLSPQFLAISIGAHAVYGLALWGALMLFRQASRARHPLTASLAFSLALSFTGLAAIASDFHARHARSIPTSPPPYVGPNLYVTWNTPEVDRLCALWFLKRFVDPAARFHFVEPFSAVRYGTAFDIPEAETRRSATLSVTEELLERATSPRNAKLAFLARVGHAWEVSRWRLPSDPEARSFGEELAATVQNCAPADLAQCIEGTFRYLDAWYVEPEKLP
jgi:hypothetical protein